MNKDHKNLFFDFEYLCLESNISITFFRNTSDPKIYKNYGIKRKKRGL